MTIYEEPTLKKKKNHIHIDLKTLILRLTEEIYKNHIVRATQTIIVIFINSHTQDHHHQNLWRYLKQQENIHHIDHYYSNQIS